MVFFACNACGESLKKSQVEKHVLKCSGCWVLSCIDCGKDFCGEDYRNHNKCISEDQKYGGKDFQVKANKGDMKQLQWIQRIHEAMKRPGVEHKLHQVLGQVSLYDNVPRKKAKFQNWMRNSLKIQSPALIEQVWEIFSTAISSEGFQNNQTHSEHKDQTNRNNKPNESQPETEEGQQTVATEKRIRNQRKRKLEENQTTEEKMSKKQKKRKVQESDGNHSVSLNHVKQDFIPVCFDQSESLRCDEPEKQEVESESNAKGKFNWKGMIKAVLRDAPEDGLAVKKLRKKVLAAYYSFSGDSNYRSEEELFCLFNKKIYNNPKFKVLKDKVKLVK